VHELAPQVGLEGVVEGRLRTYGRAQQLPEAEELLVLEYVV
jgi:hypothetical protein